MLNTLEHLCENAGAPATETQREQAMACAWAIEAVSLTEGFRTCQHTHIAAHMLIGSCTLFIAHAAGGDLRSGQVFWDAAMLSLVVVPTTGA